MGNTVIGGGGGNTVNIEHARARAHTQIPPRPTSISTKSLAKHEKTGTPVSAGRDGPRQQVFTRRGGPEWRTPVRSLAPTFAYLAVGKQTWLTVVCSFYFALRKEQGIEQKRGGMCVGTGISYIGRENVERKIAAVEGENGICRVGPAAVVGFTHSSLTTLSWHEQP